MRIFARTTALIGAILAALLLAMPAEAGMTPVKETQLNYDDLSQDGDNARAIGSIDTVKKCRQGREVTLEGSDGIVGSDRTSANGAWVVSGQGNINDFAEMVVKAKVVGKGNNRVKCGKDVVTLL